MTFSKTRTKQQKLVKHQILAFLAKIVLFIHFHWKIPKGCKKKWQLFLQNVNGMLIPKNGDVGMFIIQKMVKVIGIVCFHAHFGYDVEQVLWPFKTIFRETNYLKRKSTSLKSRTTCWDFKPSDASFKSSFAFKHNLTISRQSRPFGSSGSAGQFVYFGCKNFKHR